MIQSESAARPPRDKPDRFPDQTEWVRGLLTGGRETDAIRHVMTMYRPALSAYFAGSSFRHRFPSDETPESAVDGFFGDQMARPGFLSSWLQARSRFRYWLLVSFVHHMRHRLRREHAEGRKRERYAARVARVPRDQVRDRFDAELGRGALQAAIARAEEACREQGRSDDWRTFIEHVIDERSYNEIGRRDGLTYRQVANRVRFAQKRFVEALREVLSLGGAASIEDVRRELARLEEAMSRCRS